MLLRSSSTPVLGSLLSSFSDSPNNNNNSPHHIHETKTAAKHHHLPPTNLHHSHNKRSFGSRNFPPVSCNSSPMSPSIADLLESDRGFRRAQSVDNLEGLAYAACNNTQDFHNKSQSKKFPVRNKTLMMQTIPSLSFCNLKSRFEGEEDESDIEEEEEIQDLERNERGRERVMAMRGGEFGFNNEKISTVLSEDMKLLNKIWTAGAEGERGVVDQEVDLARGLDMGSGGGDSSGGGGSGGEFNPAGSGGDDRDNHGVEEYYKKMVEENPGNPLFLRNYAKLLYESKHDLHGAEEYYSRAILADPEDGEILSQYAKLVWELHHDQERTSTYYKMAIQASPEDSHVHAAYAGFLWESEEEDDGESHAPNNIHSLPQQFQGAVASASA
ncbi:hypothetical protein ACOSQ4_001285 [Xanthoceras sorbifolium]